MRGPLSWRFAALAALCLSARRSGYDELGVGGSRSSSTVLVRVLLDLVAGSDRGVPAHALRGASPRRRRERRPCPRQWPRRPRATQRPRRAAPWASASRQANESTARPRAHDPSSIFSILSRICSRGGRREEKGGGEGGKLVSGSCSRSSQSRATRAGGGRSDPHRTTAPRRRRSRRRAPIASAAAVPYRMRGPPSMSSRTGLFALEPDGEGEAAQRETTAARRLRDDGGIHRSSDSAMRWSSSGLRRACDARAIRSVRRDSIRLAPARSAVAVRPRVSAPARPRPEEFCAISLEAPAAPGASGQQRPDGTWPAMGSAEARNRGRTSHRGTSHPDHRRRPKYV